MSSIKDVFLVPVTILVIGLTLYVCHFVLTEYDTAMVAKGLNGYNSLYVNDALDGLMVFNNMAIFIVASIAMAIVILGTQVRAHPIYAPVGLLLVSVAVLFAGEVANVFWRLQQVPEFAPAVNTYTELVRINNDLPMLTAVVGIIAIIAIYVKPWDRGSQVHL